MTMRNSTSDEKAALLPMRITRVIPLPNFTCWLAKLTRRLTYLEGVCAAIELQPST